MTSAMHGFLGSLALGEFYCWIGGGYLVLGEWRTGRWKKDACDLWIANLFRVVWVYYEYYWSFLYLHTL